MQSALAITHYDLRFTSSLIENIFFDPGGRCGGIGRRAGLKIRWPLKPCGFDPLRRHHLEDSGGSFEDPKNQSSASGRNPVSRLHGAAGFEPVCARQSLRGHTHACQPDRARSTRHHRRYRLASLSLFRHAPRLVAGLADIFSSGRILLGKSPALARSPYRPRRETLRFAAAPRPCARVNHGGFTLTVGAVFPQEPACLKT